MNSNGLSSLSMRRVTVAAPATVGSNVTSKVVAEPMVTGVVGSTVTVNAASPVTDTSGVPVRAALTTAPAGR